MFSINNQIKAQRVGVPNNKFIINDKFQYSDCFHIYEINKAYQVNGLKGVYELLWEQKLRLLENRGIRQLSHFKEKNVHNQWEFKEDRLIYLIITNFRDRYLHRRLIDHIRYWISKPEILNTEDLCCNPFYDDEGNPIQKFVSLRKYNKIFNFSRKDIENLISNSLESSETIRPTPCLPKNPYNGEIFNCYELKVFYDFLLVDSKDKSKNKDRNSTIEKCYQKTNYLDEIPEIIRLFRYASFQLDIFCYRFGEYLKIKACENYIKDLSINEFTNQLYIAFQLFNIDKRPKKYSIKEYIKLYRRSVEMLMPQFTYYYHYFELEVIIENILLDETTYEYPEISNYISKFRKQLQLIQREISIVGVNSKQLRSKKARKYFTNNKNKKTNKNTDNETANNNINNIDIRKSSIYQFRVEGTLGKSQNISRKLKKYYKQVNQKKKTLCPITFDFSKIDIETFTVIELEKSPINLTKNKNNDEYEDKPTFDCDIDSDSSDILPIPQGDILIQLSK